MRPGQAAPVFLCAGRDGRPIYRRFNEAGAGCPGIRGHLQNGIARSDRASMRPGQAAPVFRPLDRIHSRQDRASMRPGQAAPVFLISGRQPVAQVKSFNEAGAGCPGILRSPDRPESGGERASMRPGQAAPVFAPDRRAGRPESPTLQ